MRSLTRSLKNPTVTAIWAKGEGKGYGEALSHQLFSEWQGDFREKMYRLVGGRFDQRLCIQPIALVSNLPYEYFVFYKAPHSSPNDVQLLLHNL